MNWQSNKFKECSLCHNDIRGNFDSSAKLKCWECVEKLRNTPQEKIKEAHSRLMEKGNVEMAKLLEGFLEKGESDVRAESIKIGEKNKDFNRPERRTPDGRGFIEIT